MYMAIGTYPDGREALLKYATLDEALQKIRDWAEADEIETDPDSPMFVRYALVTPKSCSKTGVPQPRGAENGKPFQLRLAE